MNTPVHFSPLIQLLKGPSCKIVIIPHIRPDGDAIGSSLACWNHFSQMGHKVNVLLPSESPANFRKLSGFGSMLNAEVEPEKCLQLIREADIIFGLDFGTVIRSGVLEKGILQANALKVHIDHHIDYEPFAQLEFRDQDASSTCELVYRFFETMIPEVALSVATAECIYLGIVTDTGSFRYASTTAAVHRIAAALMTIGVEIEKVHRMIYNDFTESRTRFLGYALYEKLKLLPEYRVGYIMISKAEQERFQLQAGDTEGLVTFPLAIEWVRISVLMTEYDDMIRMSFRSVGNFSARALASHFGGGGHFNAAGGKSELDLAATESKLLAVLAAYADTEVISE
jgi:phosphoesterase RecJ-like protein